MKRLRVPALVVAALGSAAYFVNSLLAPAPVPLPNPIAAPAAPSMAAVSTVPATPLRVRLTLSDELVDAFPQAVTLHAGERDYTLALTGTFTRVRTILFVPLQLYAIASYVESPTTDASSRLLDGLLVDGPRKVYLLRFLKPLPGSQIRKAIDEEIQLTFTDVDMARVGNDIERFLQQFANGSSSGDVVYMAWLPDGNVFSSFNAPDALAPIASDLSFARALWRIWAGPNAGPERFSLVRRFANDSGPR